MLHRHIKAMYSASSSSCHEDSPPARNPPPTRLAPSQALAVRPVLIQWSVSCVGLRLFRSFSYCAVMVNKYSLFCEQGEYQIMMCKKHLSFNQLTSVNTPPPARLAWRLTRSFRPAGLEENFRDRMSQMHCIKVFGFTKFKNNLQNLFPCKHNFVFLI